MDRSVPRNGFEVFWQRSNVVRRLGKVTPSPSDNVNI